MNKRRLTAGIIVTAVLVTLAWPAAAADDDAGRQQQLRDEQAQQKQQELQRQQQLREEQAQQKQQELQRQQQLREQQAQQQQEDRQEQAALRRQQQAVAKAQDFIRSLQRLDTLTNDAALAGQSPGQQLDTLKSLWNRLEYMHRELSATLNVEGIDPTQEQEARQLLSDMTQRARELMNTLQQADQAARAEARQLEREATAAEQAGDLATAVRLLTAAAEADPQNRALVSRLLRLRQQLGDDGERVWVRGRAVQAAPVISQGRSLVPFRALSEALGAEVGWEAETRTVTIVRDGKTVQLAIGSDVAYLNGEPVQLEVPATIIGNATYVPLRAVAELLDAEVEYDPETGAITLVDPTPAPADLDALESLTTDLP